jgi:hypothetical protein
VDADTKVKELEEEFKILKAEIRNVLLDIREVILENNNPLGDDHQGAFIRMDLNTTAQTMAANAAGRAADEAVHAAQTTPSEPASQPEETQAEVAQAHPPESEQPAPQPIAEIDPTPLTDLTDSAEAEEAPEPVVIKKDFRQTMPESLEQTTEIPHMYRAEVPLENVPRLSEWLGTALATIGPRELERVIAIERLWGNLPPNVLRALTYVQDLLKETEEAEPPWLRVMRDLDRLSVI